MARSRNLTTSAVLIDLVKAFENVVLAQAWSAGCRHRFQLDLLRMALEASSFERRLKYRGAVSRPVDTTTAILAGSGTATDLLDLVLLEPVDRLIAKHSRLRVFMVADDLTLRIEGRDEVDVAEYMDRVTKDCVEELEGQLCMTISRDKKGKQGKTVALASSRAARTKIEGR